MKIISQESKEIIKLTEKEHKSDLNQTDYYIWKEKIEDIDDKKQRSLPSHRHIEKYCTQYM